MRFGGEVRWGAAAAHENKPEGKYVASGYGCRGERI